MPSLYAAVLLREDVSNGGKILLRRRNEVSDPQNESRDGPEITDRLSDAPPLMRLGVILPWRIRMASRRSCSARVTAI